MMKNDLLRVGGAIFRVLEMREESALVIDCFNQTMPKWIQMTELESSAPCAEEDLLHEAGITLQPLDELQADQRRIAYEHYTMIAGVLSYVGNEKARSAAIHYAAEQHQVTLQTIRRILCRFLAFQSISVLAPQEPNPRELTEDEKNFRWALNKFFYTKRKNNLPTAYAYMLKERYCDDEGNLLPDIPPFHRFKYFYYKTRNMETFYISRNGMKDYKKNHRPLVGGTVQDYAGNVGMAFADSTMLDVFLVDEAGNLIARPLLAYKIWHKYYEIRGYRNKISTYNISGFCRMVIMGTFLNGLETYQKVDVSLENAEKLLKEIEKENREAQKQGEAQNSQNYSIKTDKPVFDEIIQYATKESLKVIGFNVYKFEELCRLTNFGNTWKNYRDADDDE